jgi:hypothetical protein
VVEGGEVAEFGFHVQVAVGGGGRLSEGPARRRALIRAWLEEFWLREASPSWWLCLFAIGLGGGGGDQTGENEDLIDLVGGGFEFLEDAVV